MRFFKPKSKSLPTPPKARSKSQTETIFDLPSDAYDPQTQLPPVVTIGDRLVKPFVSLQDVQDYLVLLAAFHRLQSAPDFPKIARQAAMQYQTWAQMMLPYYLERRAARVKGLLTPYELSLSRSRSRSRSPPISERDSGSVSGVPSADPIIAHEMTDSPIIEHHANHWPVPHHHTSGIVDGLTKNRRTGSTSSDETPQSGFSVSTNHTLCDSDSEDADQFIPPLAVLMAWHAHLMQPYKFAQELDGAYSALREYPFPLRQVARAIRDGTLPAELEIHGPYTTRSLESTIMDPFDIAAAVHQHAAFVDATQEKQHLHSLMGDAGVEPVRQAVLRYHAWLNIVHAAGDSASLASAIDIDLVWRAHKFDTYRYINETESSTGVPLHEPRGERNCPAALRKTSKLWKSMYGVDWH